MYKLISSVDIQVLVYTSQSAKYVKKLSGRIKNILLVNIVLK